MNSLVLQQQLNLESKHVSPLAAVLLRESSLTPFEGLQASQSQPLKTQSSSGFLLDPSSSAWHLKRSGAIQL